MPEIFFTRLVLLLYPRKHLIQIHGYMQALYGPKIQFCTFLLLFI